MNDETDEFLDLFDNEVTYIEGGRTASGFFTTEEVVSVSIIIVTRIVIGHLLPTAYVVRGRVMFSVCVSVHICGGGGGYPIPGPGGRGYPIQLMGGLPHPRSSWVGTPSRCRWGGYPIQLMGGTPSQVQVGGYPIQLMGGTPIPGPGGVPHPRSRQGGAHPGYPPAGEHLPGVPPPPPPSRSSIVCTCYAAVGMPLAFTKDHFLVSTRISKCLLINPCCL